MCVSVCVSVCVCVAGSVCLCFEGVKVRDGKKNGCMDVRVEMMESSTWDCVSSLLNALVLFLLQ